jgi:hypothetical protein
VVLLGVASFAPRQQAAIELVMAELSNANRGTPHSRERLSLAAIALDVPSHVPGAGGVPEAGLNGGIENALLPYPAALQVLADIVDACTGGDGMAASGEGWGCCCRGSSTQMEDCYVA